LFARHPPFFADRVARLFVIRLGLWWYKVLLVHLLNCVGRIILGARQITTGLCERSTNATNKKYTSCGTQQFNNWLNRVHGEMDQKEEGQ
jgi:hypothetical protein